MKYFIYCRKSSEAEDRQVLSIDSQEAEIRRSFAERSDIEIVEVFREAYSAKAPGRPIFAAMIARLEKGQAEGLIAWHPDRLARNSVDGGHIVYLLDRQKLKDLKFATFTFENNPQGKFMLAITFGYSKYYVDSLSENVKRGNRAKIEKGGWPNLAPVGYRNSKEMQTIIPDPEHFPHVRKMFELMLTGSYGVETIVRIAGEQWGYRTPKHKHSGGVPLRRERLYKIFKNSFYAGYLLWGGQLFRGKHEPIVSSAEFELVQALLGRPQKQQKHKVHTFTYRGIIRCGTCGLQLTAEHKVNRHGSRYSYYHCTRIHRTPHCTEPSVEAKNLEQQVRYALQNILIPDAIHRWALQQLTAAKMDTAHAHKLQLEQLQRSIADTERHLSNLTDLRVRGFIEDAEFLTRRQTLQRELYRLQESAQMQGTSLDAFEPDKALLSFSNRAILWFDTGDNGTKRKILEIVSSNPTLKNRTLNVEAKKPFAIGTILLGRISLCAGRSKVRTFCQRDKKAFLADFQKCVKEYEAEKPEECAATVAAINELEDRMERQSLGTDSEADAARSFSSIV